MIKEFEVIKTEKNKTGIGFIYTFKFKLNDNTYYSQYSVFQKISQIAFPLNFYKDPECVSEYTFFSSSQRDEIKDIILKRKELRLRHVVSPYRLVFFKNQKK